MKCLEAKIPEQKRNYFETPILRFLRETLAHPLSYIQKVLLKQELQLRKTYLCSIEKNGPKSFQTHYFYQCNSGKYKNTPIMGIAVCYYS